MDAFAKNTTSRVIEGFPQAILCLLFCFHATVLFAKKVTLKWDVVSGANAYEIEVFQNGKLVESAHTSATSKSWKKEFPAGAYTYHVRAVDSEGQPGQWTEMGHVAIRLDTPADLSPKGKAEYLIPLKSPITLSWSNVDGAGSYSVILTASDGKRITKKSTTTTLSLDAIEEGAYTWTVQAHCIPEDVKVASQLTAPQHIEIKSQPLMAPTNLSPNGYQAKKEGLVKFNWEKVDGAGAYEIVITPKGDRSPASEPIKKRVETNEFEIALSGADEFEWRVRALASLHSENTDAISVSTQSVRLIRDPYNAPLQVSAHSGVVFNKIAMASALTTFGGSSSFISNETGVGVAYFPSNWGVGFDFNDNAMTIEGVNYQLLNVGVVLERAMSLGQNAHFTSKLGVSEVDYLEVNLPATAASTVTTKLRTLGSTLALDFSYSLTPRFSVDTLVNYRTPLAFLGDSAGRRLSVSDSLVNLAAGAGFSFLLSPAVRLTTLAGYQSLNLRYGNGGRGLEALSANALYARIGLSLLLGN